MNKQIDYFETSARRYHEFLAAHRDRSGIPIETARTPCQIEKDERFWTATALKRLASSEGGHAALAQVLARTFGKRPPLAGFADWRSCLQGRLRLVLEATLPSPQSYLEWLRDNRAASHLIPYIRHSARRAGTARFEGATHVDALIVNIDNGFALFVEAKVLSDVSCHVSYDVFRNQMARTLDVLLEPATGLRAPLSERRSEHSLFVLLSPRCFKERSHSRLYGHLLREYTLHPSSIGRDLPHRTNIDWKDLASRLGWITFADIAMALPGACPWLATDGR